MRKLLLPLLVICFSPFLMAAATPMALEPTVIKGKIVSPELFPEAIYIRNNQGARCSSTVIGKRTLLTAAHCMADSRVVQPIDQHKFSFVADCDVHPMYEGEDYDMALCYSDTPFEVEPASISGFGPHMGQKILISGYGCTKSDKTGGNDGIFRIGFSSIYRTPSGDNTFYTNDESAICSGDSGGASYFIEENFAHDMHYVLGVNARGDLRQLSIFLAVYTENALNFFRSWSREKQTSICGVGRDCRIPYRPATPFPGKRSKR